MDLDKLFEEDGAKPKTASLASLDELSQMATRQLDLMAQVAKAEQALSALKNDLREVQEVAIPNIMAEIGMKSFVLDNGAKLTIKQDIFASIRSDFVPQALAYVEEQGLGGIIKDDVSVKFGKGEQDKSKELAEFCRERGFNFSEKLHIHSQTLKATIKGEMEKSKQWPDEFFSITPFNKAIIKL